MKSMTGFASHSFSNDGINGRLEIKSVNGKGLDVRIKIHEAFPEVEYEISNYLRSRIQRGKVNLRVDFEFSPELGIFRLDRNSAERYLGFSRELMELGITGQSGPVDFLRLPDVIKTDTSEELSGKITSIVLSELEILLEKFSKSRREEGEKLRKFFVDSLSEIRKAVDYIEQRKQKHSESVREKITQRISEVCGIGYDKVRLEEELVYYAEKYDITEEIIRLRSHLRAMDSEIGKEGNGRKLDFIFQEMHREANTIASKSSDFEIISSTIKIKDIISQMREQGANIE